MARLDLIPSQNMGESGGSWHGFNGYHLPKMGIYSVGEFQVVFFIGHSITSNSYCTVQK